MADASSRSRTPDSKFLIAVKTGDVDAVRQCIERGQTVNVIDKKSDASALYIASTTGDVELCRLLLRAGANPNQRTTWRSIGLHAAAERGYAGCASELIRSGSEVNAVNRLGESALHVAAKRNHVAVVELLLAAGAQRRLKNRDGLTALRVAEAEGSSEAIAVLTAEREHVGGRNGEVSSDETVDPCTRKENGLHNGLHDDDDDDDYDDDDDDGNRSVSIRWNLLQLALSRLSPDTLPVIATAFRQELKTDETVSESPRHFGKAWVENDDFVIRSDMPINSEFWKEKTPFFVPFEVEHRTLGTRILKICACLKVKKSRQGNGDDDDDIYDQGREWEVLKGLPSHFNVREIQHAFPIEKMRSYRRFLPLVLPKELRDRSTISKNGFGLVFEKFSFTIEGVEKSLRKRIKDDEKWIRIVSETLVGLLLYQLLQGFEHLRKYAVVHGSISPKTLQVDKELRLVISDFDYATKGKRHVDSRSREDIGLGLKIVRGLTDVPSSKGELSASQLVSPYADLLFLIDEELADLSSTIVSVGTYIFNQYQAESRNEFRQCLTAQFIVDTALDPGISDCGAARGNLRLRVSSTSAIDGRLTYERLRCTHNSKTDFNDLWKSFKKLKENREA